MSDLVPSAREALKDTLRTPPESLWLAPIRLGKLSIPTRRFIVGATLASADLAVSLAAIGLGDAAVDRGSAVGPPPTVFAVLIVAFYLGLGLYGGCGPSPCDSGCERWGCLPSSPLTSWSRRRTVSASGCWRRLRSVASFYWSSAVTRKQSSAAS